MQGKTPSFKSAALDKKALLRYDNRQSNRGVCPDTWAVLRGGTAPTLLPETDHTGVGSLRFLRMLDMPERYVFFYFERRGRHAI